MRRLAAAQFWGVALVISWFAAAPSAGAQDLGDAATKLPPPLLPGVGTGDPRVRMDPEAVPWRAVGKLQAAVNSLRSGCTGTLVAPATVLTAAHCMVNPRTGTFFPVAAMHFLIGFAKGAYAAHAGIRSFVVGTGYDHARPRETLGSDWALLTLDGRIGTRDRLLGIADRSPDPGAVVMLGGYSRDHALLLTADPACRIVGMTFDASGHRLLRHNCTGTRGVSGGPLLVQEGGKWRIAAVGVAAEMGVASGAAAMLDEVRKRLPAE